MDCLCKQVTPDQDNRDPLMITQADMAEGSIPRRVCHFFIGICDNTPSSDSSSVEEDFNFQLNQNLGHLGVLYQVFQLFPHQRWLCVRQ